jgi:hypothetical protein
MLSRRRRASSSGETAGRESGAEITGAGAAGASGVARAGAADCAASVSRARRALLSSCALMMASKRALRSASSAIRSASRSRRIKSEDADPGAVEAGIAAGWAASTCIWRSASRAFAYGSFSPGAGAGAAPCWARAETLSPIQKLMSENLNISIAHLYLNRWHGSNLIS